MDKLQIYVPKARLNVQPVRQAFHRAVSPGATIYDGSGRWRKLEGTVAEDVLVVDILDYQGERLSEVEQLATALLAAGEETVLVTIQPVHICSNEDVPLLSHLLSDDSSAPSNGGHGSTGTGIPGGLPGQPGLGR